jgi:hypothetical protein
MTVLSSWGYLTARRAAKTRQRFHAPGADGNLYLPVTRKGNPNSGAVGGRIARGSWTGQFGIR